MPHRPSTQRAAAAEVSFAQICPATPQEALGLSMPFTMAERAAVALSRDARTHLPSHVCVEARLADPELRIEVTAISALDA